MSNIPKNQLKTRNSIEQSEHEDNANARRVVLVDEDGEFYGTSGNPLVVSGGTGSGKGETPDDPLYVQLSDGSIEIGTVNAELEVQLSHRDNDPESVDVHDSVRVGDGVETIEVNPDGSINMIRLNSLINEAHDDVEITAFDSVFTTEPSEYTFRNGGSAIFKITVTYNSEGEAVRFQRVAP